MSMAYIGSLTSCSILSAVIVSIVLITAPISAEENSSHQSDRIIIGTEQNYPPYSFLDNKGEPTGFNVELTQAIAKASGLDAKIDYRPWGKIRQDLENGKINAISGMYYSKKRDELVDFSPPYAIVNHAIFARKESPAIDSENGLRGKGLIVMQGDIMHDYVLEKSLSKNLIVVKNQAEALKLLASGQQEYALIAKLPGLYWVKELKLSNIITVGPSLKPSKYCYAVKDGDSDLLFRLSEGLAIVKETGKYSELYNKWLGALDPKSLPIRSIIKYAVIIFIPIVLILAGSIIWSWSLKRQVIARTKELSKALDEVKILSGFLPICAECKKIRDDKGYWNQIESYIRDHSEAEFSHSICPECASKLYPGIINTDK